MEIWKKEKDPRDQGNSAEFQDPEGPSALLAAKHPANVEEVVVEPIPGPDPAIAVPVDVVDALGVRGVTPVGEDEHHFSP